VHQHGDGEAAVGGAAELLRQHGVGERIEPRAAELGRVAHAEKAERAHLAQDLARHVALLLPGVGDGHHAIGDEAPDGVAEHGVLLAEVGEAVAGDGFGHSFVIPGLVPGIQPSLSCGASYMMDPGNKSRDDITRRPSPAAWQSPSCRSRARSGSGRYARPASARGGGWSRGSRTATPAPWRSAPAWARRGTRSAGRSPWP